MNTEYRKGEDGKYHVYLDDERVWPGFSFTGEMLKARNDGRKTETRRFHKRAKFEAGQLVYVKERLYESTKNCAFYGFDGLPARDFDGELISWRWQHDILPARFMPGKAVRRFDRITEVRDERLQEITYEDILCEGWSVQTSEPITNSTAGEDAFAWFINLWNSINPKHPWDSNPWVFVYKFEVIK